MIGCLLQQQTTVPKTFYCHTLGKCQTSEQLLKDNIYVDKRQLFSPMNVSRYSFLLVKWSYCMPINSFLNIFSTPTEMSDETILKNQNTTFYLDMFLIVFSHTTTS